MGDGNWARTLLLYALMKTQGCFLEDWREDVKIGAVRDGQRLYVSLQGPPGYRGRLHFDFARPEWFTVDENTLYRVVNGSGAEAVWLGSELKDGTPVAAPAQLLVEAKSR